MSEVTNATGFDFFTESLNCELAYQNYWRAKSPSKRERKAQRNYCMRLQNIRRNFSFAKHVVEIGQMQVRDIMFIAHQTGRNLLRAEVQTPFFVVGTEGESVWTEARPPETGLTFDIAYINIGVGAVPTPESECTMTPVSVVGLGRDIRSAEPKMAVYKLPLVGNEFTPLTRSFN